MARGKRKSGVGGTPGAKGSDKPSTSGGPPPADKDDDDDDVPPTEEVYYSDEEGGTRIGDIYIPPPMKPHCSSESKGSRLIIKRIENENFKSYAGKVVLGPFHHRFTAIIGPNGSGKSNVIDSMLFVFGYRAQKIRCKKLSVLLHNSAKHANIQTCSVIVHFKQIIDLPDGGFEEVDGSEIAVGRTAYRDNSSYYTINGRRVQFKEVSKLLKQHGVDLDHNRFLILQGEVESISLMKPKGQDANECGMLEYLEDIIGTNRYKEPLAKINDRVEKLTEERTEKHNRCKLAEREMKDLEQPYNEAVEYIKLENALTRTKNLQIQKYLSEQNKKLEEFGVEREGLTKELSEHDELFNNLKKEREEKETVIKAEIAKFDKLCKEKDGMEKKLKFHLNKYTEAQSTMVTVNNRRKQNKKQLQTSEEKLVELQNVPEKNQAEIAECEKKLEQLTKKKSDQEETLQKNYTSLEKQTKSLIEQREKLEVEMTELQKCANDAKAELTLSESELKVLRSEETSEKRKYESLKSSVEESRQNLETKQATLREHKISIPQLQNEIATKTNELRNYKQEEQSLSAKLSVVRAEISEKMNAMKVARTNNRVLDFLMKQKMEGKIPGIFGRLGDLGGIDSKYDVAISTCCRRLDNIVVDSVNTAQACIETLKRSNVGRATIIALEKVQHLRKQCEQRINTPENVPRLFDLVRVEDRRVLPAFYFALRNTLCAAELDQATRVAYGSTRYRVVTLRGDLIETSGTMSGGGKTQMRGKMGTKVSTKSANVSVVSQKDMEDMQVQAQDMQSRINYCQQEQGRLEKEIRQAQMSLDMKDSEIRKISTALHSLTEQLPRIEAQLEAQKARAEETQADPAKVKKLEKTIEEKKNIFEESDKATKKLASKVKDMNKKIEDIYGEQVKSVQTSIDKLDKEIAKLSTHVSKLKVEITTSVRNCKKLETEIDLLKSEVAKAEETVTKLAEERTKHDQEALEYTNKIEAAKEEIEKANKESSTIQKDILAIQKKESDGKLKRLAIEEKLEPLDKKISDVKSQLPHWKNKLKPLKLQEIPGESEGQEPLKTYTEDELNTYKLQDLQYQYSVQEEKLNAKKPNLTVIQEYMNKRDTYLERVKVLEDITNIRNEMRQLYDDVRKKRYTEFMQGFHIITKKLKEMYQMITQGGDAELELVDSMDPFTEGVSFSVRPPKKSWKNISNLSGGEKTLSSLALVFALHYYKPSPLYFMDEIDAALDFKNISIVAHYIKERTKNAQFIIISLRSNMFELSDFLVGIYKVQDCTNTVTIENQPPKSIPLSEPSQYCLSQPTQSTQQELPPATLQTNEHADTIQSEDLRNSNLLTSSAVDNILTLTAHEMQVETSACSRAEITTS